MLNCNRIQLFSASLRAAFLTFESLRTHLKHQLEVIQSLIDILRSFD